MNKDKCIDYFSLGYYILDLVYSYINNFGLTKARAYQIVKDRFLRDKDIYIHRKNGFTHIDLYNSIVQKQKHKLKAA